MKIKLVLRPGEFTSFTSYYLEPLWREYFDIQCYDSTQTYDHNSVFAVWWMNANDPWIRDRFDNGHCILVDSLWEVPGSIKVYKDYYQIENPNWFWYNESLWWHAMGYNNYSPCENFKHCALMPMRKVKPERDYILSKLGNIKDSMLWSYKERSLPNDILDPNQGQRYVNRQWYDTTWSSLVVETQAKGPLFLTEKTFKPLAFHHPFQVIASAGTLNKLRNLGFETYSNLFDESYDNIEHFDQRLAIIIDNLKSIEIKSYDSLTLDKLNYNRQRFFDQLLVKERIVTEIINPIINYVENSLR